MSFKIKEVANVAQVLLEKAKTSGLSILNAPELKALYGRIKDLPAEERAAFGQEVNMLKSELEELVSGKEDETKQSPIDVTAPFGDNSKFHPEFLPVGQGTIHPINTELEYILDIFYRMGFMAVESPEIDDDYHMFTSLNFPDDHPARDDYDTFMTDEGLIAPAHTSTMQNRVLKANKAKLEAGQPIAAVIPGRVFRNEDVDARHDHTFTQLEGIYVNAGVTVGNLVATIETWLSNYFGRSIKTKIQPFYFPFTEPSFEFAASCIFCDQKGCSICSQSGWIELGGCGMIHPNVLKEAGIDAERYTGFAWGFGIERLVMLKHNIEDVRYFNSGKLEFLRQF